MFESSFIFYQNLKLNKEENLIQKDELYRNETSICEPKAGHVFGVLHL